MAKSEKNPLPPEWDYLVITASNDRQAEVYRRLISLRESLGLFAGPKHILVVADPGGRRVGSGGSTVHCLLQVLNLELGGRRGSRSRLDRNDPAVWARTLGRLRVLIVHAGGDSKRLPPYGPCGKIFVPLPGGPEGALGTALFDLLVPIYLRLPRPEKGRGQVVVASGDVLPDFEAEEVVFAADGITGIGAYASLEMAGNHGVYCREEDGGVRLFLQKPSAARLAESGAVGPQGRAILDIGILNFEPAAAVRLLELCDAGEGEERKHELIWRGALAESIERTGLDIYREICCALGRNVDYEGYVDEVRAAGSESGSEALRTIHRGLRSVPFHVHVVPQLRFLHFGTLQDLVESGRSLMKLQTGAPRTAGSVLVNSRVSGRGAILGEKAWIEGCRVGAPLTAAGNNVVVGVDISAPLALPKGGCLDVLRGKGRDGRRGWFVRIYSVDDAFHLGPDKGGRLGGRPVSKWLEAMGAGPNEVWEAERPAGERTVWTGRFFPFVRDQEGCREWLWLLEPGEASAAQKAQWLAADRYSLEEIALRADLDSFHSRRFEIRSELMRETQSKLFGPKGPFSASEIAFLVRNADKDGRAGWIVAMLREAVRSRRAARQSQGLDSFDLSRILHTLGSVLSKTARIRKKGGGTDRDISRAIRAGLTAAEKRCLGELGLTIERSAALDKLAAGMKEAAFRQLGRTIADRSGRIPAPPRSVLRSDEIVWGRAPARLDLGGGWTDTPPYSLERGGCVINAAIDLNGQPPIQAYARVIEKREIRIHSIDHGTGVVIRTLDELLDYRDPGSQFALGKAALALAGFAPGAAAWPAEVRTLDGMLRRFGGGMELTTMAAIPSGSGLGTSSIMGAVLMAVIGRAVGRPLARRELFHAVLKLEQELTTGGGWQDQIGGAVEGVKIITSERGLVPDPRIRFVPADLLDPAANAGRTLLYYTGLRRLAKNILHEVVGRYLDRDRQAMETLGRLHAFPPLVAEAMEKSDAGRFGELVDVAWKLNVALDPDHTTPVIEDLRARIGPYVSGAKLLGAGGGGFLLMVCRSPEDAAGLKRMLEKRPPNDRARFFDYSISREGLAVTVC